MNLSIPDAAVELGVSETRLRKTLTEIVVTTLIEFRRTRTGVRKTTVLGAEAIGSLRAHYEAPLPEAVPACSPHSAISPMPARDQQQEQMAWLASSSDSERIAGEQEVYSAAELRFLGVESAACHTASPSAVPSYEASISSSTQEQEQREDYTVSTPAGRQEAAAPLLSSGSGQSVPLAQFNALLYQHNVLREELARVSDYLEGCDRLLGEMVRTISTLEERTMKLERSPGSARGMSNPLTGALRSVSAGVQNALFARSIPKPAEVYYANVLTGR